LYCICKRSKDIFTKHCAELIGKAEEDCGHTWWTSWIGDIVSGGEFWGGSKHSGTISVICKHREFMAVTISAHVFLNRENEYHGITYWYTTFLEIQYSLVIMIAVGYKKCISI
jgi:hypothetical protein